MRYRQPIYKEIPLEIVGADEYGRYPKISAAQTFNMFMSDRFLVPYAGYKAVATLNPDPEAKGRGMFNSERFAHLIAAVDNEIYVYDKFGNYSKVADLETFVGTVYFAENNANQIGICDQENIYIFNYSTGTFTKAVTGFKAKHIAFKDGYFIAAVANSAEWRLSALNNGLSGWTPSSTSNTGEFQTKADNVLATVNFPGRGNQLLVMGGIVTEPWSNLGLQLFPFQRSSGYNIDYGVANAATIATGDTFVVWLGKNEKSGLAIMYSTGGDVAQISNDGINYKLASVKNLTEAYGFLFKQDGRLFYQLTFPDKEDDFTLTCDLDAKKFYTLTDHKYGCHIAKRVAEFNNSHYFVSFSDGKLYEMNSKYTTYDGNEIPRIRTCKSYRQQNQENFIVCDLGMTIEQGTSPVVLPYTDPLVYKGVINVAADFPVKTGTGAVIKGDMYEIGTTVFDNDPTKTNTGISYIAGSKIVWSGTTWDRIEMPKQRVDLSISQDGGESFSCNASKELFEPGQRENKLQFRDLGKSNDFTPQFRFYGLNRFVVTDGTLRIMQ